MENILAGLDLLFQHQNVLYLIIGLVIGFTVGALPGFSSSNAAAIVLPFTIAFTHSETALIFMAAIYAGAQFAGAIPAILINTPGTTGAAATTLDGYPMAQKGQGELAVGIARMASVLGGLIGITITIIIIGPMASLALRFGPVEMFLLAIFGLTLISTIVGNNVRKGLLSGALGLLIAAMGADPYHGQARFHLGFFELYESVPFIPILIGIFALTEMFFLVRRDHMVPKDAPRRRTSSFADIIEGITTTLRYPKEVIRAALLGTFIGAVPGTGTTLANFISYGIAKKASKHPEKFGTGVPEGVIASEACDSAVVGGTMIPTLALGIPGSTTAAIMLAALLLHGVRPGPQVMVHNAPEVYAILLSLVLATLFILPLGIVLVTPMIAVTKVQPKILVPGVLLLCVIGSYAVANSMFFVWFMLVFGLLGFLMKLADYPVVPLVLGLILGPIAEANFVRAYLLSGGDFTYFFSTPISWVLWAITFFSLFSDVIKRMVTKRVLQD